MTQVILDSILRSKLHNLSHPLELCDETGKVVAQVIPVLDAADYEPVEPPELNAEELQRRREEKEEYSTAEMLAHLENL
jgi:hypothetical protein